MNKDYCYIFKPEEIDRCLIELASLIKQEEYTIVSATKVYPGFCHFQINDLILAEHQKVLIPKKDVKRYAEIKEMAFTRSLKNVMFLKTQKTSSIITLEQFNKNPYRFVINGKWNFQVDEEDEFSFVLEFINLISSLKEEQGLITQKQMLEAVYVVADKYADVKKYVR